MRFGLSGSYSNTSIYWNVAQMKIFRYCMVAIVFEWNSSEGRKLTSPRLPFLGWPRQDWQSSSLILKLNQRASVKGSRFHTDWIINQAFRVDTSLLIKHKWTRLGRNPNGTVTDNIIACFLWPFNRNLASIELTNPPLDSVDSREVDCTHTYSDLLGEYFGWTQTHR